MNNSNHANDQYQSPVTQLAHLQAQLALCQTQARLLVVQRAIVQTNMVALQGQAHAFDLQMNEVQTKMAALAVLITATNDDIAAVVQKEHRRKARKALTDKWYRERQAAQAKEDAETAEKKRRAEEETKAKEDAQAKEKKRRADTKKANEAAEAEKAKEAAEAEKAKEDAETEDKKRRAEEEPACEASGTEQNPKKHKQGREDFVRAMDALDEVDKADRIGVALPLTPDTGASGLDSGWAPSTGHDLPFV